MLYHHPSVAFRMSDSDDSSDNTGLWQELKTVTIFDKNETKVVNFPKKNIGLFSPASLFIESLIEYICTLVEKNMTQRKQMYITICQKFFELHLIDETYSISDFDFIRNHYRKELHRFICVARSVSPVINPHCVSVPTISIEKRKSSISGKLFDSSRFSNEYYELEFIARGAFGEVFKVQNKLDAGIYAIKKICLKYCSVSSFIRGLTEVQMLAKLSHPNIVSYKAAWLEPLISIHKKSRKCKKVIHTSDLTYSKKDDSSDVVFLDSDGSRTSEECECKAEFVSSSDTHTESSPELLLNCNDSTNEEIVRRTIQEEYEVDEHEITQKIVHEYGEVCKRCSRHRECAVLFIQMQLCHETLRQWLDRQNLTDRSSIDLQERLRIYLQIVRGVEFIHSKEIVHHDIKPTNIFISKDGREIQVGDFGLSCCWLHDPHPESSIQTVFSSSNCPLNVPHQRGEIGTKLYAAPEQLNGICDLKSDIYSLGILLFELVYSFHTNMERVENINRLRKGILPTDLSDTFPNIADLIEYLTNEDPAYRPVSSELLKTINDMLDELQHSDEDKGVIIKRLKEELYCKNEEIALLKQKLAALQAANQ